MFELLMDNRNGNVWDISSIVSGISWSTSRIGKPGKLEFTLIKNGLFQNQRFNYSNGDVVRFKKDNINVFYGYVFSIESGKDEAVRITCYDQIRYLLSSDTYVFENCTAAEVLKRIASDFKLKLGRVEDTIYRIPKMVEDGKKLLDIICKALDYTLINTKKNYFLFDDFGYLSIRNSADCVLNLVIGDESLMLDFSSKRSIDSDTYNKIQLYQDNKKTGKRDVYIAKDSANIAKWGILQLYQSVDENMNTAQINELLSALATLKNRETKSLSIQAIGDLSVRAGCFIPIIISEYQISQYFLIDSCTHDFDGAEHTMSLELKVI